MEEKQSLRTQMRSLRQSHVSELPETSRALLFLRPPGPLLDLVPEGTVTGLYHASSYEAPTRAYARWLFENGRSLALPWFADRHAPMRFRSWCDPFGDSDLEPGPYGTQPSDDASELTPSVLFVPLLGFTEDCQRLGQGGGHYDRWLAEHPDTTAIGLAWDVQKLDAIPLEPHDQRLRAVVTPTRIWHGESLDA